MNTSNNKVDLSNCQSFLVSLRQLKLLERSQISESLSVFMASGHTFFKSWRTINAVCSVANDGDCDGRKLCADAIDSAIEIVVKYELDELKLAGKGMWLLHSLLKFSPSDLVLQKVINYGVTDLVVKMLLKHQQVADTGMQLLKLLIYIWTPAVGLQEVCKTDESAVLNELPKSIMTANYISLMHVVLKELQAHFEPEAAVAVMSFFAALTPRVEASHSNNYFLAKFAPLLRIALSSLTNFNPDEASLHLDSLGTGNCELYLNTLVCLRSLSALHAENVSTSNDRIRMLHYTTLL